MKTCERWGGQIKFFFTAVMVIFFPLVLWAAGAEVPTTGPDTSEAAIEKGKEVFRTSCQACHSLKYMGYASKMSAQDALKAFGDAPPDLNLITKARGGSGKGAAYIYAFLTGFNDTPGKNSVFPNTTMPPPFSRDDAGADQKARNVSAFLDFAAEPSARERTNLGRYALGYMIVLTALLYALNRRTWKEIGKNPA